MKKDEIKGWEMNIEILMEGERYIVSIRCPLCRCPKFLIDNTKTLLACANPKCDEHRQTRPPIKLENAGMVIANIKKKEIDFEVTPWNL